MKTLFKFMFLFTFALVLTSCDSDDDGTPEIVNEEEVITTVIVNLDPGPTGTAITLRSFDSDGDGPTEPVITVSDELAANTIYEGEIQFLNETESPAEDITEEVREEDDEHQVFYTIASGLNASVTYEDFDGDNNPLGTLVTVTTTDASTGLLTVTLRHEPKKPNDNTLLDAGGETDVQVSFPVVIN